MPPRNLSRHTFAYASKDEAGASLLHGTEPFRFVVRGDTIQHVVNDGDTLHTLAARYFKNQPRPAGLWWAIADFQPDPIHDPTRKLAIGRTMWIPSERTLTEEIFSSRRRIES